MAPPPLIIGDGAVIPHPAWSEQHHHQPQPQQRQHGQHKQHEREQEQEQEQHRQDSGTVAGDGTKHAALLSEEAEAKKMAARTSITAIRDTLGGFLAGTVGPGNGGTLNPTP